LPEGVSIRKIFKIINKNEAPVTVPASEAELPPFNKKPAVREPLMTAFGEIVYQRAP